MRLFRCLPLLFVLPTFVAPAHAATFDPARDTLAFANETYYEYATDPHGQVTFHKRSVQEEDAYSRHCFVMVRTVLQFHKFAVFRPDLPKLDEPAYGRRLRQLSATPVWSTEPSTKVVIPGYPDLRSFSADHVLLFQRSLGAWWPSFWRLGNWRIVLPVPRAGQARLAAWLRERVDRGQIAAVYLTRFRPLNHCMVVYGYRRQPNGDVLFSVYDPNRPNVRPTLRYTAADRSFTLDKNWYWGGGRVTALRLYQSPLL